MTEIVVNVTTDQLSDCANSSSVDITKNNNITKKFRRTRSRGSKRAPKGEGIPSKDSILDISVVDARP